MEFLLGFLFIVFVIGVACLFISHPLVCLANTILILAYLAAGGVGMVMLFYLAVF